MSFITAEEARLAGPSRPQDQRRVQRRVPQPGMSGKFLDFLTTAVNTAYPGAGPLLNPTMYQKQAEEKAKAEAAAATKAAAIAAAAPTPAWILPAAIVGGMSLLAIIVMMATGGGRRSNPVKSFRRRLMAARRRHRNRY